MEPELDIIGRKMSGECCSTWAGVHVLLQVTQFVPLGVRNNHLKFIQLITNWSQSAWLAELRGDWRLSKPLATWSRDLCGLHSERQSGIIINFSNNLILGKYSNIYISTPFSRLLVKLHCQPQHLVGFLSSSLRSEVK